MVLLLIFLFLMSLLVIMFGVDMSTVLAAVALLVLICVVSVSPVIGSCACVVISGIYVVLFL